MVYASQGRYYTVGAMAKEFTLSFTVTDGDAAIADIPSTRVMNWCGLIANSLDQQSKRHYGSLKTEALVK